MKRKFVQVESREEAYDECSWAAFDVEVEGGFMMFESYQDYLTYLKQK